MKNDDDLEFYYGNHFVNEDEIDENLRMPQLLEVMVLEDIDIMYLMNQDILLNINGK